MSWVRIRSYWKGFGTLACQMFLKTASRSFSASTVRLLWFLYWGFTSCSWLTAFWNRVRSFCLYLQAPSLQIHLLPNEQQLLTGVPLQLTSKTEQNGCRNPSSPTAFLQNRFCAGKKESCSGRANGLKQLQAQPKKCHWWRVQQLCLQKNCLNLGSRIQILDPDSTLQSRFLNQLNQLFEKNPGRGADSSYSLFGF